MDSSLQECWDGEARLLPSSHHTQQSQRMTNNCEKRAEEEKPNTSRQKAVPKLENAPRVRNSLANKKRLYIHVGVAGAEK